MTHSKIPLSALRLAEGRLEMLLGADLPDSDHPSATRYVLARVRRAISALAAAAREGGDVKQAPAESPQSGGEAVTPKSPNQAD